MLPTPLPAVALWQNKIYDRVKLTLSIAFQGQVPPEHCLV